jgi:hypothetical protein
MSSSIFRLHFSQEYSYRGIASSPLAWPSLNPLQPAGSARRPCYHAIRRLMAERAPMDVPAGFDRQRSAKASPCPAVWPLICGPERASARRFPGN